MDALKSQVFKFLNELRDSCNIDMHGAVPYIMREFALGRVQATNLLKEWMEFLDTK